VGEIDEVGGLRGCERWGTESLLRSVGLQVFASGYEQGGVWVSIGQRRGEVLLEVLQKLRCTPKFGAAMHMASSRGLDNPQRDDNT